MASALVGRCVVISKSYHCVCSALDTTVSTLLRHGLREDLNS